MSWHWLVTAHPGLNLPPDFPYPDPATFRWSDLDAHWSVLLGIALLTGLFFWGIGPARRRYRLSDTPAEGWRIGLFSAAMVVLFFSLQGPLHHLSDYYLFSAHMVQHLLLMQVVPPMVMLAIPGWLIDALFDRVPPLAAFTRVVVRPLYAFLITSAILVFWHIPEWYELTMRDHEVHIFEHITFISAAVIYWWPVINLAPRHVTSAPPIFQMIYLFLTTLPMVIVGAFITMSSKVIYPFYAFAPRVFDLDPLTDQIIGGLIMWVPGAMMPWVAITTIFFRWFQSGRDLAGSARPSQA